MAKISLTGLQARDAALRGAEYLSNTIKSTIGPHGSNALLEKGNKITNDGYTISAELVGTIENEFERRGATILHEASAKTNDTVGDATSTASVLAYEITKEATRYLASEKSLVAKKTPSEVLKMIEEGKNEVIDKLAVTPMNSKEELIKSAQVSVEDEKIAELLGSTQWELGPEGIIIAEEVNETECSIERVRGLRLDNGFGTSHVVTNPERQSLELSDMHVLMTNYTIDIKELMDLKKSIFDLMVSGKKLGIVIIARAFTSEAIKACMESLKTGFAIFPVNAPYVYQSEIMHDMEAVLGGRYIDNEESRLEDIHINDIGFCKRFIARQFDAVVTGVDDEKALERSKRRVETIKAKLAGEQSDFQKKFLESRIAQLTNGFALLKVGSTSVVDRKRLKDKCDDAVHSVRLALKGGTVKGGGLAFKEIADTLDDSNILKRPIQAIYNQIISSAPADYVIPEWVRDPYLTLVSALTNACATASVLSNVGSIICEENPYKCNCNKHEQS
jgi:chaperonin GroEL